MTLWDAINLMNQMLDVQGASSEDRAAALLKAGSFVARSVLMVRSMILAARVFTLSGAERDGLLSCTLHAIVILVAKLLEGLPQW